MQISPHAFPADLSALLADLGETVRSFFSPLWNLTHTFNFTQLFTMLRTQPARAATCALRWRQLCHPKRWQLFYTTVPVAAISPPRRIGQIPTSTTETAKRGQSTAAATAPYVSSLNRPNLLPNEPSLISSHSQSREVPSPAFNQESRRNEVHPLLNRQTPAMDES